MVFCSRGVVVGYGADGTHWIFSENFIGMMVKIDATDACWNGRDRGVKAYAGGFCPTPRQGRPRPDRPWRMGYLMKVAPRVLTYKE
ncbi:MAG: hypothetical protein CVV08_21315 [Gammaproteobacteria bacterium HGW-Gammaproteobacteria-12]|nr:MAG: hypothetical protein CVV08_21315 [Gammaproteobacteria bacterium HGW-Gammaproteobacteria-12]